MRPDHAQATLQFMSRVQLNAQEIPAFQECCAALSKEAEQPQAVEDDPNDAVFHDAEANT